MAELYNPKLRSNSRLLRRNMTKEEKHLWYDFLKKLPVAIKRQKVFENYIVDFYCASARLIIELDGSQHYTESGIAEDLKRDDYFKGLGITVLRYSNVDVNKNFEGVCYDILKHIGLDENCML